MTTTIPRNSVGFSELLDHAQQESHRWHDWFNQHSQALDVKIDIAGSATVRDLLSHIVFVDLLFAEWLLYFLRRGLCASEMAKSSREDIRRKMGRDDVLSGAHGKHEGQPAQMLYTHVPAWDEALGATRYRSAARRL